MDPEVDRAMARREAQIAKDRTAQAALRAHAEWMRENGMVMVQGWQPIETAPRDGFILLYGEHGQISGPDGQCLVANFVGTFCGYWDPIDQEWCSTATTFSAPLSIQLTVCRFPSRP
jgi:hypothetical protein